MESQIVKATTTIFVERTEINFDRACEEAYSRALNHFRINDYWNGENFDRSTDAVVIEFKEFTHTGSIVSRSSLYVFTASIVGEDDEL